MSKKMKTKFKVGDIVVSKGEFSNTILPNTPYVVNGVYDDAFSVDGVYGLWLLYKDFKRLKTKPPMNIQVKMIHPDAKLPTYATKGSACFDFYAIEDGLVTQDNITIFSTGLEIAIPEGWELKIYSRSGHGFKHGVALVNSVGIIDSDYRDEIKIALTSHSGEGLWVKKGDRIAQGQLKKVKQVSFESVKELPTLEGNERVGGFGSTGE